MSKEEQVAQLKGRLASLKEKGEEGIKSVMGAAAAGGTGAILGAMVGYSDDGKMPEVGGVPAPAVAGIVAHLVAMSSKSKYNQTFRDMGNGALAVAAYDYMKEKSAEWKAEEKEGKTDGVSGRVRQLGAATRTAVESLSGDVEGSRLPVRY